MKHLPFTCIALIAIYMLCGCITIPTPEQMDRNYNARASSRTTHTLSSGTDAERAEAAKQLRWNRSMNSEEKIGLLRASLKDPYAPVRSNAAGSIGELAKDPAAKSAVSDLRANLADSDAYAALNAAVALQQLDEPDAQLLTAARAVFQRDNLKLEARTFAASMMASVGASDEEVAPALVDGLASRKGSTRTKAFNRLGRLKSMPASTIPHYVEVLKSTDPDVLQYAAIVVNQKFRPVPKDMVAPAAAALTIGDPDANENLMKLIGNAGKEGAVAIPTIAALLYKKPLVSRNERVTGVTALGNIKQESDEAVDALLHVATTDPDAQVRDVARMHASTFTENTDKIRSHFEDLQKNGTDEEKTRAAGLLRGLDAWQQIKQQ